MIDACRIAREACPVTNAIIPAVVGNEAGTVKIYTFLTGLQTFTLQCK